MPALVIPNVIANGIAADGDNVGANFTVIANWAGGNVGNDNYSNDTTDRLELQKYATPRNITVHTLSAWAGGDAGALDSYYEDGNFAVNVWQQIYQLEVQYVGRIDRTQTWVSGQQGIWELRITRLGLQIGATHTILAGRVQTVHNVAVAVADVLTFEVRTTTDAVADQIERHVFECWMHYDHQAT